MRTIYKYNLVPQQESLILPIGAKVLHVAFQGENLCMWAEVYDDVELTERFFRIFGTGHHVCFGEYPYNYIGTAEYDNSLIFHVYEYFKVMESGEEND